MLTLLKPILKPLSIVVLAPVGLVFVVLMFAWLGALEIRQRLLS